MAGICEIESVRDVRLELARLEPRQKLLKGLSHELRLVPAIGAPVEADDVAILDEHQIGGDLGDAPGCEADHNDAALPRDRAQALIESIAAHGIVNHVGSAASRDL